MELAIDTSSNIVSVALSHNGEILASLTWQTTQNHTIELLPNLVYLLQRVKVELDSIGAIIVAKGPGRFNGLRVGISTAKGLASALNIPLLGVSTLEAIISQSNSPSRASSLAILGWRKLSGGEQDDPVILQPLYLRPPHITKPRAKTPPFVTPSGARETRKWKFPD